MFRQRITSSLLLGCLSLAGIAGCASEPIARPSNDSPPTGMSRDCYIDVYKDRDFHGPSARVWGPATYQDLKFNGVEFRDVISSVIVGPGAIVRLNDGDARENHSIILTPNMRYSDLSKVNFEDKVKLIEVNLPSAGMGATQPPLAK